MTGLLAIVAVGFVLGMRHACDADHVVAISTIVTRYRSIRGAAMVGAVWGLGHTVTIMVVGAAIIGFSVAIPPRLGLSLEMSVGVMLIVLGAMNLSGVTHRLFHHFADLQESGRDQTLLHSHEHSHDGHRHSHPHIHLLAHEHETIRTPGLFRALGVGIVHGLAGSAAIALLVLSTIHDPLWSAVYLLVFGAGTIGGMMLISIGMAVPLAIAAFQSEKLERVLVPTSGLLSLGFGVFIVLRIGLWDGLL